MCEQHPSTHTGPDKQAMTALGPRTTVQTTAVQGQSTKHGNIYLIYVHFPGNMKTVRKLEESKWINLNFYIFKPQHLAVINPIYFPKLFWKSNLSYLRFAVGGIEREGETFLRTFRGYWSSLVSSCSTCPFLRPSFIFAIVFLHYFSETSNLLICPEMGGITVPFQKPLVIDFCRVNFFNGQSLSWLNNKMWFMPRQQHY